MTTRREFIRDAAASGLVFCTCGLIDAAYAQGSHKHPNLGSKRKPVIINGRRRGSARASGGASGPSQVVLGTDHPIPWEEHPVDHVMATTTLSLTQRAAILGGNAARLLNIKDV